MWWWFFWMLPPHRSPESCYLQSALALAGAKNPGGFINAGFKQVDEETRLALEQELASWGGGDLECLFVVFFRFFGWRKCCFFVGISYSRWEPFFGGGMKHIYVCIMLLIVGPFGGSSGFCWKESCIWSLGSPKKNGAPTRVPFGGYTGWWYFSLSDKSLIGKGVSWPGICEPIQPWTDRKKKPPTKHWENSENGQKVPRDYSFQMTDS